MNKIDNKNMKTFFAVYNSCKHIKNSKTFLSKEEILNELETKLKTNKADVFEFLAKNIELEKMLKEDYYKLLNEARF